MPNYVYSVLEVKGKKKDLQKFKSMYETNEKVGGSMVNNPICNDKVFKYPRNFELLDKINRWNYDNDDDDEVYTPTDEEEKELILIKLSGLDTSKDGYNQGGYDWYCNTFGSKWGFCNPTLSEEKGCLIYHFESAWSPMRNAIKKMSEDNPNVKLTYDCEEEGGDFAFIEIYSNGECIEFMDRTDELKEENEELNDEEEVTKGL